MLALLFVLPRAGQGAVGHAEGGAAVFGLLQTDNVDSGTAAERRRGLSQDVLPACLLPLVYTLKF